MSSNIQNNVPSHEVEHDDHAAGAAGGNECKQIKASGEFSWYGGKVDEDIVREIVRLKREHKL